MVLSSHVLQYIVRCIVRQYYNTIRKLWLDVPKRLKINGLITPDSHEFPRRIHSLFRDTSQTPGGLNGLDTGQITGNLEVMPGHGSVIGQK